MPPYKHVSLFQLVLLSKYVIGNTKNTNMVSKLGANLVANRRGEVLLIREKCSFRISYSVPKSMRVLVQSHYTSQMFLLFWKPLHHFFTAILFRAIENERVLAARALYIDNLLCTTIFFTICVLDDFIFFKSQWRNAAMGVAQPFALRPKRRCNVYQPWGIKVTSLDVFWTLH